MEKQIQINKQPKKILTILKEWCHAMTAKFEFFVKNYARKHIFTKLNKKELRMLYFNFLWFFKMAVLFNYEYDITGDTNILLSII